MTSMVEQMARAEWERINADMLQTVRAWPKKDPQFAKMTDYYSTLTWEGLDQADRTRFLDTARCHLKALRTPTKPMTDAAFTAGVYWYERGWNAMLDAAESEPTS